jgi:hypothetical protein
MTQRASVQNDPPAAVHCAVGGRSPSGTLATSAIATSGVEASGGAASCGVAMIPPQPKKPIATAHLRMTKA